MAQLWKGAPVAAALTQQLIPRAQALRDRGVIPTLAILRVGERPEDLSYERGALKRCEKVGIAVRQFLLTADASQRDLMETIEEINRDESIKSTRWFKGAIYLDYFYGEDEYDPAEAMPVGEGTSVIQDIVFKNIDLETVEGNAVYLVGLPESPARRIRLENVTAKGKWGMYAENVEGLFLKNVSVEAEEGDDVRMKRVKGVVIR